MLTSNETGYLEIDNSGICWCMVRFEAYSYQNDEIGWQFEGVSPIGWGQCFDKGDTTWWAGEWGFAIHYGKYHGGSGIGDTGTVPCYPSFNTDPYMTADSTEGVWVCWWTDWWYHVVAYNRYKDGSWGEPLPITDTFANNHSSAMTTDALGRVWAGWIHIDGSWDEFKSPQASFFDGENWSDEMTIYPADSGIWVTALKLTPDREGGMWAIWSSEMELEDKWALLVSHWDGIEWSQPDTLTRNEYDVDFYSWGGRLAVDKEGNAWAVWREDIGEEDPYGDIYFSVNCGDGWCEPEPINPAPGTDHKPDIAVDGEGRIWCVWGSIRDGGEWGVYVSQAKGSGANEEVIPQPILTVDKRIGSSFIFSTSNPAKSTEIQIFDATGQKVKNLEVNTEAVSWNGTDIKGEMLPGGVYFVRVNTSDFSAKERVILLKQ